MVPGQQLMKVTGHNFRCQQRRSESKNILLQRPTKIQITMDDTQTINTYEEILITTNKMLVAAQNSEWEELIGLEKECKSLTNKLVANNSGNMLSNELQQKKIEIIHQVLANDAQIRLITEPWMKQLQNMLNTAKHENNLQQAYQPVNTA
jgi:flagellar protein FliT